MGIVLYTSYAKENGLSGKEMFDDNLINVQMQVDIKKNKAAIREAEEKAKQLQRRARAEQIRNEKKLLEEAQKASLARKAKLKEAQGIESIELPSEAELEKMRAQEE